MCALIASCHVGAGRKITEEREEFRTASSDVFTPRDMNERVLMEPSLRGPGVRDAVWTTVLANSHSHWLHVNVTQRRRLYQTLTWLRETMCGLRGHSLLLHFESHRVCLECSTCGHQTPGWHVSPSQRIARRMR
jgi:hypothetical protein